MISLYEDQQAARTKLFDAIRAGYTRIIFKLPTGGGKTVIAADLAASCLRQGRKMIFAVDAISLIDQTVERFVENGVTQIGVIQADHPATDYSQPIQIASVQTLARRHDVMRLIDPDLIVVDEAHCQYQYLIDLMARWTKLMFIGLTATPYAKGMGKSWEVMVEGGTIRQLIDLGRLSPYRIYAASSPNLKGVRTRMGDYVESDLSERMSEGALVSNTVGHWRKHAEGRPTLAFCVDRTHAKHVQREFEAAKIPCGYVDAYTTREERQEIAEQFRRGELKVVTSVGTLTKGVDWDVRCILLLRPTKSEALYLQIVGRGLRTAEGKTDCLILDHSDTALRLGFPEEVDERNTELCDGEKSERTEREKQKPSAKKCPSCNYLKPAKVHQCPACGFMPEPKHIAEEVEAELVELTKHKQKLNRDTTPEQKGAFYAGLLGYANERGYKPGWAANKYKEKFGVWPNAYKHVQAGTPSTEVRNWIKSSQIRYAKRRAA